MVSFTAVSITFGLTVYQVMTTYLRASIARGKFLHNLPRIQRRGQVALRSKRNVQYGSARRLNDGTHHAFLNLAVPQDEFAAVADSEF